MQCVVFNDNTKTVERWEESPANRKLVVPSAKGATVFVDCVWADVEVGALIKSQVWCARACLTSYASGSDSLVRSHGRGYLRIQYALP